MGEFIQHTRLGQRKLTPQQPLAKQSKLTCVKAAEPPHCGNRLSLCNAGNIFHRDLLHLTTIGDLVD